jgi:hypothetical protein
MAGQFMIEERSFPGWSGPLLGLLGGAIGALGIASKYGYNPLVAVPIGAGAGLVAGLLVWGLDVVRKQ